MSSSTVVNLHLALLVGSLAYEDEDDYVDTCSLPVSIHNITVPNWLIYSPQRTRVSILQFPTLGSTGMSEIMMAMTQ